MKAKVIGVLSKADYTDQQRRLVLKFEGSWNELRVPESSLGIVGLGLDDELEVIFRPLRERAKSEAA